jgi:hypothetical protein
MTDYVTLQNQGAKWATLEMTLIEIADYLYDYVDVDVDVYGTQHPNDAMRLRDETLERIKDIHRMHRAYAPLCYILRRITNFNGDFSSVDDCKIVADLMFEARGVLNDLRESGLYK